MSAARPRISVVIPTFKRPDGLVRAARSVFAQDTAPNAAFELVIVDNDPAGSALIAARGVSASAPPHISVKIIHCPEAGVANARNAAMEAVETPLVAFLDDDQTAPTNWLSDLLATYDRHRAAVTFGPVLTLLPETVTTHRPYFEAFFARAPVYADGPIEDFFGCGNALLDLEQMRDITPLFNPDMNESGGEDDLLFNAIAASRRQFAWSPKAFVNEHVPESRARLGYTLRRALAYGQGPCTIARKGASPDYGRLAMWTVIGAGQATIYGAVAAAAFAFRLEDRAVWLDKAARGFGKVVWWRRFDFYGTAMPSDTPPASSHGDGSAPGQPAAQAGA